MALTKTNRGTGGNGSGANSIGVVPGSNCTAGALVVLIIAYDNAGSAGSDPYSSISDTKGNTWTPQLNVLNDPTNPSAGCVLRFFTTPQDVGTLTTGDTITISFGSTSVAAKAWVLHEWTGSVGVPFVKTVPGAGETSSSASPTITSSSIHNATAIVAAIAHEYKEDGTDDADTTNGSWSSGTGQKGNFGGAGVAGMAIISQSKIVTAAGTQTYNPTFINNTENSEGWIQIAEAITVTPTTLTLALSTFAPTVTARDNKVVTPSTLALALSLFAPTVRLGVQATPGTLELLLSTFAPTVQLGVSVTPSTLELLLTAFAPTVQLPKLVTPGTLALVLTTFEPSVQTPVVVTPGTQPLVLATFAPTVETPVTATPSTLALVLTPYAPTVQTPRVATPPTLALVLTTYEPTVTASGGGGSPVVCTPETLALVLTGYAPTVTVDTLVHRFSVAIAELLAMQVRLAVTPADTVGLPETFRATVRI